MQGYFCRTVLTRGCQPSDHFASSRLRLLWEESSFAFSFRFLWAALHSGVFVKGLARVFPLLCFLLAAFCGLEEHSPAPFCFAGFIPASEAGGCVGLLFVFSFSLLEGGQFFPGDFLGIFTLFSFKDVFLGSWLILSLAAGFLAAGVLVVPSGCLSLLAFTTGPLSFLSWVLPPSVLLRLFCTSAFGKTSVICFPFLPFIPSVLLGLIGNPSASTCRASLGDIRGLMHTLLQLCLLSTACPNGLSIFSLLIKHCWALSFPRILEYFLRIRVLAGVGEFVGGWLLRLSLTSSTLSSEPGPRLTSLVSSDSTWSGFSRNLAQSFCVFQLFLAGVAPGNFFKCFFKRSACSELGYRLEGEYFWRGCLTGGMSPGRRVLSFFTITRPGFSSL